MLVDRNLTFIPEDVRAFEIPENPAILSDSKRNRGHAESFFNSLLKCYSVSFDPLRFIFLFYYFLTDRNIKQEKESVSLGKMELSLKSQPQLSIRIHRNKV